MDSNKFDPQFATLQRKLLIAELPFQIGIKMSKSGHSDQSRKNLTDDADMIAQKIKRAKTDSEPIPSEIEGLKERPEVENLVGIFTGLAEISREEVVRDFASKQFSVIKPALAEFAVEILSPVAEEMRKLTAKVC